MRNKRLIPLILIFISSLFIFTPIIAVQGKLYDCPSTSPGDTKILQVTTVDEIGLEGIFGSGWKNVINTSFSGNAATKGAKLKTIVRGITTNDKLNYTGYGLGMFEVCNITVDSWAFTTGEFLEANKTTSQVYVIKDPANLTAYVQTIRTILSFTYPFVTPGNVTIPWAADASKGILSFLGQLAVPPDDYLDDITWDQGWTTPGKKIVHEVTAGYFPPFTTNIYQQNCTETWTYYDNGALVGYSLVNNTGTTVYEYSIVLPGAEIPGYDLSIFIGISTITMIGLVYYVKKKR